MGPGKTGDVHQVCQQETGHLEVVTVIAACFVKQGVVEQLRPADLRRLLHAHVAHPTNVLKRQDHLFLFAHFVPGWSFQQIVTHCGRLPPGAACELVRQAAWGLDYLHHHGRTHAALSPTSLVLGSEGREAGVVKVTGVALSDFADLQLAGYVPNPVGDDDEAWWRFLVPETVRNVRRFGIQSDVYGLGCILFPAGL